MRSPRTPEGGLAGKAISGSGGSNGNGGSSGNYGRGGNYGGCGNGGLCQSPRTLTKCGDAIIGDCEL